MINLTLTDEEAFLLGMIFRISTRQRQQAADTIDREYTGFNWEHVNLGHKIEEAAGAEKCSPYLMEVAA